MPTINRKILENPPKKLAIGQLVDRFGSNRKNAAEPGKLLAGCTHVSIPFAGGLSEVPFFLSPKKGGSPDSIGTANGINVNDLDRHVINLARVVRDRRADLAAWLDRTPYHADQLEESQAFCRSARSDLDTCDKVGPVQFAWACHYFVASWLTRGGSGGTRGEFNGSLSVRWKAGGGDSVVRFRSATEGLAAWEATMSRCTFTTLDAFDFLAECSQRDVSGNGIYCDPPWPDDGEKYRHKFTEAMQRRLAEVLTAFAQTRIVVRYGDHPLIRELYPESRWTWRHLTGRTQANKAKAEVLLTNWRLPYGK